MGEGVVVVSVDAPAEVGRRVEGTEVSDRVASQTLTATGARRAGVLTR